MGDGATASAAIWSPGLRKIMAGIASLGALETGYLTYSKLANRAIPSLFCGNSQSAALSCDQVLNGPYSNLPFLESVPLAAVGFAAYSSVVLLALWPLLPNNDEQVVSVTVTDDTANRILLTALTTAMGTFSIFLMALLFGFLNATCPYCIFSAFDSFMLLNLALIGGCLPEVSMFAEDDDRGLLARAGNKTVLASFGGAIVGAVLLFGSGNIDVMNKSLGASSSLLATAATTTTTTINGEKEVLYLAPEITTESSAQALTIAKTLKDLDAKMYGAHWCSHCADQKQALGKQVFDKQTGFVPYIECSKDGVDAQAKLCKAKEIPGYPTWEINGKLYPGEQTLEELEEVIKEIQSNKV